MLAAMRVSAIKTSLGPRGRRTSTRSASDGVCPPLCWPNTSGTCDCEYATPGIATRALGAVTKRTGTLVDFSRFLPALSPGIAPGLPVVPSATDPGVYLAPDGSLTEPAAPFWTPGKIALGVGATAIAVLGTLFLVRR